MAVARDRDDLDDRSIWGPIGLAVVLSLLFHFFVVAGYWKTLKFWATDWNSPPTRALETRVLTESQLGALVRQSAQTSSIVPRKIVETEAAPSATKPTDHARFLGERTQRVEKETVAPGFGSATGGRGKGAENSARPKAAAKPRESSPSLLSRLGLNSFFPVPDKRAAQEEASDESAGDGRLARGSMDQLPKDVVVGARTILNTDEYVYASFFNRVRREVAPRWEPSVRRTLANPNRRLAGGQYYTEANFWLDAGGRVTRVEITRASGVVEFDEAARESLRSLPPMLNPPVALRESEGVYRMQLGFTVNLEATGIRMDYAPDPRL